MRSSTSAQVRAVLAELERLGSPAGRAATARYGIVAEKAFGLPPGIAILQKIAKGLGRDHELALALWDTGWFEARMLASFVDEPAAVTPAQMDHWARGFDNWGICDAVCFTLFDRSPHAWKKLARWSRSRGEFVKRAAFALLAGLALHDKQADDERFLAALPLIEAAASDERNFVKKGVSWALRAIGRRNLALNAAALEVAKRLAGSEETACRWVGKDALRELASPKVRAQLAQRARKH
jgi:3-methyladenine DNA glycosylase AlkD